MAYIPLNQELTCLAKRLVQRQIKLLLLVLNYRSCQLDWRWWWETVSEEERELAPIERSRSAEVLFGTQAWPSHLRKLLVVGVRDDHAMDVDAWEFPVWLNSCILISDQQSWHA